MVQARGVWLLAGLLGRGRAGNPIMLPSLGLADPHAHVWPGDPDTVFVYATHDCSPSGRGNCTASRGLGFRMDDWWVWSTTDLLNWTLEATVSPSVVSWETNDTARECWATDAAQRDDGETFFYLSVGPKQIGVVSGPTPRGPFSDPIGKALVPEGLVPSYSRDPCVFREGDDYYLIWGTFSYYVAKLDGSLAALAEAPRPVVICVEFKSSTRIQCARMRQFRRKLFGCASSTRREQSIHPKISRIDFDLIELENFKVWSGPPTSG